ncbi:MAG TPA: response regulator [Longimicrobiales bacterium]
MANILIVDDEPAMRRLLNQWLTLAGHQVVEAALGAQAIDMTQLLLPDLIIMDVKLPDISGLAAAQEIRALPGLRATPVICLTGLDMRVDVAQEGGCTDLLLKPVTREALIDAVQRHLKFK